MAARRIWVLAIALLIVPLTACGGRTISGRACGSSSTLVPSCGVLWGVTTNPHTATQLHEVEQLTGTHFAVVYRFHDLNDRIPTDDERALVSAGRTLHISIDARIFGAPNVLVTWQDIAAGRWDQQLIAQARGIASLRAKIFVTFDHEPDLPRRTALGTAADYVAAWRHVHDLFIRAGASNAVWVWVVTGDEATWKRAGDMWPGNDVVDWISWESYNASGCRQGQIEPAKFRGFSRTTLPFYRWVLAKGPAFGIGVTKPMMISEAASVVYPGKPGLTAAWYRGIPQFLEKHPQIKAIALWDNSGQGACRYQFDEVPAVVGAIGQAGSAAVITGE